MLCTYLCAATFSSWIALSQSFKYADKHGSYKYCWTIPFKRRYEPHQIRVQAINAMKAKFNASFCDISYVQTVDPWLKHNQTRYKVFIIAEQFANASIRERHIEIKKLVQPLFNNPGDSRIEILARSPEEKPEGHFTEEEMAYNMHFMNEEEMPIFGGNRLNDRPKRSVLLNERQKRSLPLNDRPKRNIFEYSEKPLQDNDMSWKFPPEKTCRLVEEIIRKKFDPQIVKCESMHEELRGRVGPGHEDQYKILVVSKKFLDQPPLRRTINVRKALDELINQQMYKIHMTLKTIQEYEKEKDIERTTDFQRYE
uniref:Uncharacterized protein n=1 Tax=Cacopsylla melanoneura TaxID=428564 RepID=A0A8D8Y5M2_9HEMI